MTAGQEVSEQTSPQTPEDQLSELLAQVVDDYLDDCATLDEVDSNQLAQQLAAVVLERRMPPGVHYVPRDDVLRSAWGH